MFRWLVVVFAITVSLGGLMAVAYGVRGIVEVPKNGWYETGQQEFRTERHAIVIDVADLTDEHQAAGDPLDDLDNLKVRFIGAGANDSAIFIGIAHSVDMDQYLGDTGRDVADDVRVDGFAITSSAIDGGAPRVAPGKHTFWSKSVAGRGPQYLEWTVEPGDYRLVIMNEDGSATVDVDGSLGTKVPYIVEMHLAVVALGVALASAAVAAALTSLRARRRETPRDRRRNLEGSLREWIS